MMQRLSFNGPTIRRSANSCRTIWLAAGLMASLAAAWIASPATAQTRVATTPNANTTVPAAAGRLPSLVRETAAQFQIAYRHNAAELARRLEQLDAAVAAWRAAARSAANDQLMDEWLRTAIRKSMPGSREPLPPLPKFARSTVTPPVTGTTASPWSTTSQKPIVDNSGASRAKAPSGQKPAEHAAASAATPSSTAGADHPSATQQDTVDDFWSAHPANSDLPADLSGGDPFQDDPPSAEK